jgi:hypothetical protein
MSLLNDVITLVMRRDIDSQPHSNDKMKPRSLRLDAGEFSEFNDRLSDDIVVTRAVYPESNLVAFRCSGSQDTADPH